MHVISLKALREQASWSQLDLMLHLRPIQDEASYSQMIGLMNTHHG